MSFLLSLLRVFIVRNLNPPSLSSHFMRSQIVVHILELNSYFRDTGRFSTVRTVVVSSMEAAQELRKSQPHSNGNFLARDRASAAVPAISGRRLASGEPPQVRPDLLHLRWPPSLPRSALLGWNRAAAAKSSTAGPPSATCGLVGHCCDLRELPPKPCALPVAGIEPTPHRTTAGAKLDSAPSGVSAARPASSWAWTTLKSCGRRSSTPPRRAYPPLVRPRPEHGQRRRSAAGVLGTQMAEIPSWIVLGCCSMACTGRMYIQHYNERDGCVRLYV
jgi:hypothetical protein